MTRYRILLGRARPAREFNWADASVAVVIATVLSWVVSLGFLIIAWGLYYVITGNQADMATLFIARWVVSGEIIGIISGFLLRGYS